LAEYPSEPTRSPWAFHFVDAPFIAGFINIAVGIQICQ